MTEEQFVEHVAAALPANAAPAVVDGAKRCAHLFYDPALEDDDHKQLYVAAQRFSLVASQFYAVSDGLFQRGRQGLAV